MKKRLALTIGCMLLVAPGSADAALSITTSRQSVSLGQSFNITVRSDDTGVVYIHQTRQSRITGGPRCSATFGMDDGAPGAPRLVSRPFGAYSYETAGEPVIGSFNATALRIFDGNLFAIPGLPGCQNPASLYTQIVAVQATPNGVLKARASLRRVF